MSLGPKFNTPFTDLTGNFANHQYYSKCGPLEMKVMNCLEAYGLLRGKEKCIDLLEDFNECVLSKKQIQRIKIMREERDRQYNAGERSKEDYYAKPPKVDSY